MANSSSSSGGVGFTGLLTIVFIVLKLLNKITWSWIWVLSPMWIVAAIVILFCIGALVTTVIITKRDNRKYLNRIKKTATLEKPKRSSFANKMEEMMKLQKDKKVIKD